MRERARALTGHWYAILLLASAITPCLHWNASADEKITYRLKWLINMSTVGDVMAESQGFFKDQGLEVTLKPGGPERDAIRELEMGYAHFGVASADQVIQAVAKGAPVVVIAQLFQINPLQWIYFKDRLSINSLNDLKNRTIGVTFGKNDEIIMRTLLARAGISENQVRLYSVRMDYTPFYKKQVDLWPVYINTQAVEIARKIQDAGESVGFLAPSDHGVHFVANSVVTSERLAAEKPELVRRFLNALIKGWRVAVEPANAESAISSVRRYDRDTPHELLVAQLKATRHLVETQAGITVGGIDRPAWEQTEQIMLTNGLIKEPVNIAKRLHGFIESER
ncbi:MAG: nitrate ABC transporter substrate-binding protein [Desulfobacteraceae bacterium]|nr:MAG: nitrate ABC transporter substrate-binding protein [Desulfobacteraceae bacterium]